MLTADGHNAPAPWVPYTRAGCNFGAVSTANIVLENNSLRHPEGVRGSLARVRRIQGKSQGRLYRLRGHRRALRGGQRLCSIANNGQPDLLPDEPGGYSGFNALYGTKYVNPMLGGTGSGKLALNDLNGQPITNPDSNTPGFPGFDGMTASVSLAYVAYMQEHGAKPSALDR